MAIQKITGNIIGSGAVAATTLDAVVGDGTGAMIVPKGTTAQRPGSPVDGYIRYNTTVGALEQYVQAQSLWTNVGELSPAVSSISGIINTDTNSTITITGTNFQSGAIVTIQGAGVSNSDRALTTTFVNPTTLTAATAAASVNYVGNASFNVKVTNPSGLNNILTSAGTVDRDPVWSTSAGSLGTVYDSLRATYSGTTVSASDPDGTAVTYSVTSGSLPTGLSLNSSTGAITGTPSAVGSDTTSPFTITATSNSFTADRAFSITIKAPTVVSYTTVGSGTFSVPSGISSVWVLAVAGGGSGAAGNGTTGGGGAGGYVEMPTFPVTPGGTVSYSVGGGGAEIPNGNGGPGQRGTPTTFGTLTAIGGGGAQGWTGTEPNSKAGGSGGGGAGPSLPGGPGIQPAQPGNSGTYGYGYPGGNGASWVTPYDMAGAGGGGAGGAGSPGAVGPTRGNGGVGKASTITTSSVYYAGGGGGTGQYSDVPNGPGGAGGTGGGGTAGGVATRTGNVPGQPGTANTGGGGGAGTWPSTPGGNGGPGIVIVRY